MHSAQITRATPTSFIFLLDQSGSMAAGWAAEEDRSKAEAVALVVNRIILELLLEATKDEGVRHYYDLALIGYGSDVHSAFSGDLAGRDLVSISEVADSPARIQELERKVPDGAGGLTSERFELPIWVDPVSSGKTPMSGAFRKAVELARRAAESHPESFPPTVVNVTDGASTDGNPTKLAKELRSIETQDGPALLFNVHISSLGEGNSVVFPESREELPPEDSYADLLYDISSEVSDPMRKAAREHGLEVAAGAKGFAFNAKLEQFTELLNIGTIGTAKLLTTGGEGEIYV